MFKVEVIFEYRDGHFKSVDYWFKTNEEYESFKKDEKKKEHLRKITSELKYDPQ